MASFVYDLGIYLYKTTQLRFTLGKALGNCDQPCYSKSPKPVSGLMVLGLETLGSSILN